MSTNNANKKTSNTGAGGDPAGAQDNLNALYTAHQVHTLAQIVFQQLAGSWSNRVPCTAPAFGMGGMAPNPFFYGQAFQPAAPPALFYWYP